MKFSFRKIGSVLASGAMLSSTVALAAAANFPAPYVTGGTADVAIVHGGTNAAYTDLVAVADISSHLSSRLAQNTASGGSAGVDTSVSGETAPLFTSGTKLYINDTIKAVKNVLTKAELPTVLEEASFSGDVDTTVTQTIDLGFNPRITFKKQPTSDDDPNIAVALSTTIANYLYNASATFQKTVNFTHPDSAGEEFTMFGQTFTISSATDATDMVLLKSAEKFSVTSDDPSREVTVGGNTYTIDLVSASDSAATVRVTDSSGGSNSKEISENTSKKVQGITIAVTTADETNLQLSATIIAGAEKVTLADGTTVTTGEDAAVIDGTNVKFSGASATPAGLTKIIVSATAPESDEDAIKAGESFVDPVFGSFKLEFAGLNIGSAADDGDRETIDISPADDDQMELTMTDYNGVTKTFKWAINTTTSTKMELQLDDELRNITVREMEAINYNGYVMVGNEDEAHLLKLSSVTNSTTGTSSDRVEFTDIFSGDTLKTTWTAEGSGTVSVGGKTFNVYLTGASGSSTEDYTVKLNYPDSTTALTDMVAFPTIETSKGARLALYEPLTINISDWDGPENGIWHNLTTIRIPDGDGYTDIALARNGIDPAEGTVNVTFGSTTTSLNKSLATGAVGVSGSIGQLVFNVTGSSTSDQVVLKVVTPAGASTGATTNTDLPAIFIFEEKDDNNVYEAMLVTLETGGSGDDGIGVDDIVRTWGLDASAWEATMASDSKKTQEADLWGTISTIDSGDSDQKKLTISYPDEQVHALIYMGSEGSSVTTSGGGSGAGSVTDLGSVSVADTEVGSVAGKNLIVIGGSCVNSEAANLLGVSSPTCGADWTAATGVASGEYLIETFARTGDKVATLVAGFNAGDTTNAGKALTTQGDIDTTAGKKYKGTTSTAIEAVMEETA
jgi:hypothetical protein